MHGCAVSTDLDVSLSCLLLTNSVLGRNLFLNTVAAFGLLWAAIPDISISDGDSNLPCFLSVAYTPFLLLFSLSPLTIRTISFYYRIQHLKMLSKSKLFQPTFERFRVRGAEPIDDDDLDRVEENQKLTQKPLNGWCCNRKQLLASERNSALLPDTEAQVSEHGSQILSGSHRSPVTEHSDLKLSAEFKRVAFLASYRFGIILFLIGFLMFGGLGLYLVFDEGVFFCQGCELYRTPKTAFFVVPLILLQIFYLWKIRKEPDPFWIRRELTLIFVTSIVLITLITLLNRIDPGDLEANRVYSWSMLYYFSLLFFYCISIPLQLFLAYRNSKTLLYEDAYKDFNKVMRSEIGRMCFRTHLVEEMSLTNLLFYQEVKAWKSLYRTTKKGLSFMRFKRIYNTFLAPNSRLEINIQHNHLQLIQAAIANEKISIKSFDIALIEVKKLMVTDSFARFQCSRHYQIYRKGILDEDESLKAWGYSI